MTSDRASPSLSRRAALLSVGAVGLASCVGSSRAHQPLKERGNAVSRFTLNLECWWRAEPLERRIDKAAAAGFLTAEMWSLAGDDRDPARLKRIAQDAGISIIHCTVEVPDLAVASAAECRDAVARSLDRMEVLGARFGTIVGHQIVGPAAKADMLAAYRDRIAEAAPLFEQAQITACIEPFNPFDHPGFFLYGASDAVAICRSIDSPRVKINWDLFHMQRHEGNVVHRLREGIDQCGMLQIADSPDRREPGTGEMNYAYIMSEAQALGFDGPIGLECFPTEGEEERALERVNELAASLTSAAHRLQGDGA